MSAGLRRQLENDRRLRAMREFIADYEREHGKITDKDIEESLRTLQSRAIHVRPVRAPIQAPVVRGSRAPQVPFWPGGCDPQPDLDAYAPA